MVSNARLDLPEPESPVTTIRLSRGISSEMFLRLWTRAPCTAIVLRAVALPFISCRTGVEVAVAAFLAFRFIAAFSHDQIENRPMFNKLTVFENECDK